MMGKKYQLAAWTRNITDQENARLYMDPSVEYELLEPLFTEVSECRKEQEKANGLISPELARRFIIVDEQSARLEILSGNIDHAIRFLLQAAEYCINGTFFNLDHHDRYRSSYCEELRYEFERFCEEAISLARKHGFRHILQEKRPAQPLKLYLEHLKKDKTWRSN